MKPPYSQQLSVSDQVEESKRWKPYPAYKDSGVEWLGEVPKLWEVKRLKDISYIDLEQLPENTSADYTIFYVDIGNVDSNGNIIDYQEFTFEKSPSRARKIVRSGDTILSTVRTYLKAIAFIHHPPENLIVSTGFAVLHPKNGIYPKYLWRLVQSQGFIDTVVAYSEGVSYPAITPSKLTCLPVWVPSIDEQRAIATFLDRETAKIDALVAKKQRLIELLQEKRTALISQAVTKGLDPNVPMKDSGVEWLGKVPAHWDILRNKWIFSEIDDASEYGKEELLTVSHITGITTRAEKEVNMFMAESLEGYKKCRPGDLVINTMWAWMGALGISKLHGIVSPSYNVYRLKNSQDFHPQYLDYLFRTPQHIMEITRYSNGVWSSRLRLYPDEFFLMSTPQPPYEEQKQIVDFIEKQTRARDLLAAKAGIATERLQEYRTALISAAVTGKIDVRDTPQ